VIRNLVLGAVFLLTICAGSNQAGTEAEVDSSLPEGLSEGWYARIETGMGGIIVQLLPEQAPQSVAHFAGLAEGSLEWIDPVTGDHKTEPYYDGLEVERSEALILFEASGRRPDQGAGPVLFVPQEGEGPINFHQADRIGMQRARSGGISGVQFVVTAAAQPALTGTHPCFGRIVSGREVVLAIAGVKTYSSGRPVEPITIERIRVFRIGSPSPLPAAEPYLPQMREFGMREDIKRNRK